MNRRVDRRGLVAMSGRIALIVWLVAGCSAIPATSWTPGPTIHQASPSPVAAAPSATDTPPSIGPQPTLAYPEVQSRGELTIAFESPAAATIVVPLACEWTTPVRVAWLTVLDQPTIAGEDVWVDINLVAAQDLTSAMSIFSIFREGAAAYATWPAGATGSVSFVERAPGDDSGRLRFVDLRPEVESAPAGPMPTPLATWTRPLGGDPAYQTISGTVTWDCQSAPPTVPTPGPVVSEEPTPPLPSLPRLSLVAGEQRQTGVAGCGGGFQIDGQSGIDSCGPSFQAPGDDRIVRLDAGAPLRFVLPDGWTFTNCRLGWVLQSEAERFRMAVPDSYAEIASLDDAAGRVLELEAPPAGDWTVLLTWSATRGEDEMNSWPDYFRVIVESD